MDALLLGLRVLVSLAAVFGLMWLVHRKVRGAAPGLRARVLSVVARQNVGPKASVVLVDTDGKRFLLGVTEHGISVLHTSEVPQPSVPGPGPGPDPDHDAVPGEQALPHPVTRRSLREASFESELERRRDELGDPLGEPLPGRASRPARPGGSVLEPATWRLAAEALRSGRRP